MEIPPGFISYNDFISTIDISIEKTSLDFIRKNRDVIKIKKENVAQKNLISIFNGTLNASNEKGFQNMSMRDLSKETGLSLGALYSYFPGKIELLTMIFNHSADTLLKIMEEQMKIDTEPREKINRLICVHLYVSEIAHDWFYFFYMETKNLPKDKQEKMLSGELKTEEFFLNLLKKGELDGTFHVDDPSLTASFIKSILQDWYLKRGKFLKNKVNVEHYAKNLIKLIESYVLK